MITTLRVAAVTIVGLLLSGCIVPVRPPAAAPAIDWARAPVVRITLSVGFFHPGMVTLAVDRPVRLVFDNSGGRTHDFVTRLFGFVATRPGTRPGGARVILQVSDQVEYDIVPRTPGIYGLYTVMFEPPGSVPPAQIVVKWRHGAPRAAGGA